MKNAILVLTASMGLLLSATTVVKAQRYEDEKKYWEHRKEKDKKRAEYYRERDKKQAEYYREQRKKEAEYYKEASKRRKEYYKDTYKYGMPRWAKVHRYDSRHHVYFREYRTFYDPYRRGYVFLDRGNWRFSPHLPSFLVGIDLGHAQIRIIKDIPISRHPEEFYYEYDEDYWRY